MGGLALKTAYTRRYTREEFDKTSAELVAILEKSFKRVAIPLFYSEKESFGDIDIIVSTKEIDKDYSDVGLREYIEGTFCPNEIFYNGNAWSFDYEEVQVDLIIVEDEHFDSNYHYLAFNDLGNFIGRIAQRLGLKYGQEGLWYNHYYKDQKIGKITVSKDYPKIFEFLGFDYERWKEGFSTLDEIFEYVAQNEHFDHDSFQLENLNKINRERNAKRKSYMSFLEYIAEHYSEKSYEFDDKKVSVDRAMRFFPEARMKEEMRRLEYLEARKLYINSKFSGGTLASRYGLKGKHVGDTLKAFKDYIQATKTHDTKGTYYHSSDEWILNTPTEEIYVAFEEFYKDNF